MTTEPVDPARLLSTEPVIIPEFSDPPPSHLPLNGMPWEHFERLCARLLADMDASILQAFRYGSNAQGQGGIDIIATLKDSHERIVVECKRVKKITPAEITRWISRFLARENTAGIRRFIFAVTANVQKDKHLLEAWMRECERLRQHKIEGVLWDLSVLEPELAARPNLIDFFFGPQARERFGRQLSPAMDWPFAYRKEAELVIERAVVLENLSVRLNMLLPTESEPNLAPILMFSRADLRGLPLAIRADTFTQWMQWAASSQSLKGAPFLLAAPGGADGSAFLQAGSGMPQLQRNEIKNLHWLLARGWTHYMQAVRRIDSRWKVRRFPMHRENGSEPTYGLCTVTEEFWRAILDYTEEFDSDRGRSDQHIFNAHRTGIIVYVGEPRAGLQPGFHVNLPARRDRGYLLNSSTCIRISWQVLERFKPLTYSPDQAWDAEYSHQWLMRSFLPAVLAWALKRERKSIGVMQRFAGALMRRDAPDVSLEAVASSLANDLPASDVLELRTRDDARRAVAHLLSYANRQGTEATRPRIDAAVLTRLHAIDQSLRGNTALSPSQLQNLAQELQPLWNQRCEETLRDAFS